MARANRSTGVPIILGSVTVALSIALLVGWIVLIARSPTFSQAVGANVTLLVGGIVSIVTIITVLVLFSIFLVREIQEVRRQYSFIDSVTHELKSPLASLKLCVETLGRPQLQESQRGELRTMMLRDIERLTVFIDDILEVSRLSHGRRSYSLATVTLAPLVRRCVDATTTTYRLPPSAISVDVDETLGVTSDETALEILLKNLLDNAVKYSPPTAVRIVVSAERREVAVLVSVRDFGIGVPKAHLKRIFDRFYRVPNAEVYARQGTGLGLFVVSSLARALGVKLTAHSDGPGRGTTMTLRFETGEA